MPAKARFVWDKDWQREVYNLPGMGEVLMLAAARITNLARAGSPRRAGARKTPWNTVRRHIDMAVDRDEYGYIANVVIEANPKVRHAMLQEEGFYNRPADRRIPGRRFIKEALLKARVE
ncbi:hypothetical protein [Streptomyces sp. URMC 125]|uniref:hypothetical protein n=1 Tax=Streptomyces sp. URMC 125 TaxID=3423419 RepID=UPI003F1CE298